MNLNLEIINAINEGFTFYSKNIMNETQIKRHFGDNIFNINVVIKVNEHIFLINADFEKTQRTNYKLNSFINDCILIKDKLNNKHFILHAIYLSPVSLTNEQLNYLKNNGAVNININNCDLSNKYFREEIATLVMKLYYYIADTTKLYFGLKDYLSDDIIMTERIQ